MSKIAIDLLIEAGLLTSYGKAVNINKLSMDEVSQRIKQYNSARISVIESEINSYSTTNKLNALFSSSSTRNDMPNILSSCLVYDSIILNDPLVTSSSDINLVRISNGLRFFEWAFELIKSEFILIIPISYINKPNNNVPILTSEDCFQSSIPREIHDFIHENKIITSVKGNKDGSMIFLDEDASVNRRTLLKVGFKNDYWRLGVGIFKHQTLKNCTENDDGTFSCERVWYPNKKLDFDKFNLWSYQSVNQAMMSRLNNIYNETYIAEKLGHTYVTESNFEAKLLSMSGLNDSEKKHSSARFLDANHSNIQIDRPETIIELRDKYSSAFERFNFSLQSISDELSNVSDEEFDDKAKKLFHKEIMPQIDEIRSNANAFSGASTKGFLATMTGFSIAIATGSTVPIIPSLLIGLGGAMAETIPLLSNISNNKKKPSYIWHKIANKSK